MWLGLTESPVLLRCLSTPLGTAQISPQQHSKNSATKILNLNQREQNGNFCSAFPTSAGLKPPNVQQPGLQLSKTTNTNRHIKKTFTPSLQKDQKDLVFYSTEEIFIHTSLYLLHCLQVFASIPSQTKKKKRKKNNSAF